MSASTIIELSLFISRLPIFIFFLCGLNKKFLIKHKATIRKKREKIKAGKLDIIFIDDIKIIYYEKERKFEEVKIYKKDFNSKSIKGKHIAPHTLEMASMWAVLTRLEIPKKANLTLLQKLKLYNGKTLPGFTEDNVRELRKEANREFCGDSAEHKELLEGL